MTRSGLSTRFRSKGRNLAVVTVDPWCTDLQVRTCPRLVDQSLDHQNVAGAIAQASRLLTEWSGRRYGLETITKTWTAGMVAVSAAQGWADDTLARGADPAGYGVALVPGGRVDSVLSVVANGVTVPSSTYRLVNHDRVVPVFGAVWWTGFTIANYDSAVVVTYKRGRPVPEDGTQAAIALAAELLAEAIPGMDCALSPAVVRIVRQGVTIDRPSTATGVAVVDQFLSAANPDRIRRPATILSPDMVTGYQS